MQFSGHGEPMANPVCDVLLTEAPLEAGRANRDRSIVDLECGALVEFHGIVRGLEQDRAIDGIDYEANSAMAIHQMELIAQSAIKQFGLAMVLLHHRIGFVPAGEPSLWLRVGTGHRGPALEAVAWIIDELKRKVPIWKQPKFNADASSSVRAERTQKTGRAKHGSRDRLVLK